MTFNDTTNALIQIKKAFVELHKVVHKDDLRTHPELIALRKEAISIHYTRINILQKETK